MDTLFRPNNLHWEDPKLFLAQDPNLAYLKQQSYINEHNLLQQLPTDIPGIYTLGGGRQIGKTTLLKQWVANMHYVTGFGPLMRPTNNKLFQQLNKLI